eukprot:scaffold107785_cov62-Phaeocystis_antarctica.AAC.1
MWDYHQGCAVMAGIRAVLLTAAMRWSSRCRVGVRWRALTGALARVVVLACRERALACALQP